MKRSKVTVLLCIIAVVFLIVAALIGNTKTTIKVMDSMMSYAGYERYEDALGRSTLVVYGTVKEIGKSYCHEFVINSGKNSITADYYYTPIVIEIEEVIMGDVTVKEVTYNALGGRIGNKIYDYQAFDTLDYEVGDKILVFLRNTMHPEIGYECIGPQCVISEDENGKATREALGENKEADTLEKQVELVKNAYSKMLTEGKVTE